MSWIRARVWKGHLSQWASRGKIWPEETTRRDKTGRGGQKTNFKSVYKDAIRVLIQREYCIWRRNASNTKTRRRTRDDWKRRLIRRISNLHKKTQCKLYQACIQRRDTEETQNKHWAVYEDKSRRDTSSTGPIYLDAIRRRRDTSYTRRKQALYGVDRYKMCDQNWINRIAWIDISDEVISWNVYLKKQYVSPNSVHSICCANWKAEFYKIKTFNNMR